MLVECNRSYQENNYFDENLPHVVVYTTKFTSFLYLAAGFYVFFEYPDLVVLSDRCSHKAV